MEKIKDCNILEIIGMVEEFIIEKEYDNNELIEDYISTAGDKNIIYIDNNRYTLLMYEIYSIDDENFIPIKMEFIMEDNDFNIYDNFDFNFMNDISYNISIDEVFKQLKRNYDNYPYLKECESILRCWQMRDSLGYESADDMYRLEKLFGGMGKTNILSKNNKQYTYVLDYHYIDMMDNEDDDN